MLSVQKLKSFIPTINPPRAKYFYKELLGLNRLSEDNFGMEFDSGRAVIRVTTVRDFKPQAFAVLGWHVNDIESIIKELVKKESFLKVTIFCNKMHQEYGQLREEPGLHGSKMRMEICYR